MLYSVFGRENCPYCVRAKELLTAKELNFEYLDVGADEVEFLKMNTWVTEATGYPARSVPQIFLDGSYIGGYDKLTASFAEKEEKEVVDSKDFDLGDL